MEWTTASGFRNVTFDLMGEAVRHMTTEAGTLEFAPGEIEPEELRELLAVNSLFNTLEEQQIRELASLVHEIRTLEDGDYLVHEGDVADEIFIIKDGEFEVLKEEVEEGSTKTHRLAVLTPGMSIGEVSLLDAGPRSATVRSMGTGSVLVVSIAELESLYTSDSNIDVKLKINLAYEMGRRLRTTNETTVRTLREKLNESEKRAEMGRFMSRVLIGTCLYMFALSSIKALKAFVPDTTMITVPILLAFAIGLALNIKLSIFPASAYGFTLHNWRAALTEAFLFSLPVAGLIVLVKFSLVQFHPKMIGMPVFDFYQSKNVPFTTLALSAAAYTIFAPVQEMITRSGMQSSFMMFLDGKYKTWLAIFLSTLLFSSTHLHVSFILALLVFPIGLFWGWLYSRNPTLIGVSTSHVMLGLFGLFVIGFPTK